MSLRVTEGWVALVLCLLLSQIALAESDENISDSYTWELSDGDTKESVKFNAEAGDTLAFELNSSSTEVTIELYKEKIGPDDKIKTWSGQRNYVEQLTITKKIAGTFYFKVSNPGIPYGDKTNVSFWFQVTPGNNDDKYDPILFGLIFLGVIGVGGFILYRWSRRQQTFSDHPPM